MNVFSKIDDYHSFYDNTIGGVDRIFNLIIDLVDYRKNVDIKECFPVFFIIFGLQKIKSLGDYVGSELYEKLKIILSKGPELGIHSIVWVDAYNRISDTFVGDDYQSWFYQHVLYKVPEDVLINLGVEIPEDYNNKEIAIYHDWNNVIQNSFRMYNAMKSDWIEEFLLALKNVYL